MNKYTVVGIAPNNINVSCRQMRNDLEISLSEKLSDPDNIILKDTAHFAIKRSFRLHNTVTEPQLIEVVKSIKFKPLQVRIGQCGVFEKTLYGNIVYVKLEVDDALKKLHTDLVAACAPLAENVHPEMEGDGWIPHLSVAYFVPDKDVEKAIELTQGMFSSTHFELREVFLLGLASEEIEDRSKERDERRVLHILRADEAS